MGPLFLNGFLPSFGLAVVVSVIRWFGLDLMTPPQFDCEQTVVNLTACDFWSQALGSSRTGTITAIEEEKRRVMVLSVKQSCHTYCHFRLLREHFVLAWSLRKASDMLSESYCQNGHAILAQALLQITTNI